MTKGSVGSLVWIKGLRDPAAEKWPNDMPSGGKVGKVVLAEHELSADEYALKIAILEQRYPCPKPPQDGESAPAIPPQSPAPSTPAKATPETVR
jgi:hypothetical protein